MEVLVAGEGDQGAEGNADRVEDLGGGVDDSCDSLYDSLVTAYLEAEQLSLENFFLPQVPCLSPQFRMT